jgi:hypothetical protein
MPNEKIGGFVAMPSLLAVLYIKIVFTALVWATPALLTPEKLSWHWVTLTLSPSSSSASWAALISLS